MILKFRNCGQRDCQRGVCLGPTVPTREAQAFRPILCAGLRPSSGPGPVLEHSGVKTRPSPALLGLTVQLRATHSRGRTDISSIGGLHLESPDGELFPLEGWKSGRFPRGRDTSESWRTGRNGQDRGHSLCKSPGLRGNLVCPVASIHPCLSFYDLLPHWGVKFPSLLGMVAQTYNPSTLEAEAGRCCIQKK